MLRVKTWDAIVVGAGVIGLATARQLQKGGARVLIVERGEPGREASHAAAGMLADADPALPQELRILAVASARMYPEFAQELLDESGMAIDLRQNGTIGFIPSLAMSDRWQPLSENDLKRLEPRLEARTNGYLSDEGSVDPRALVAALRKAAKHRGIEIVNGETATEVTIEQNRVMGLRTTRTKFQAEVVVNCAGAWAGEVHTAAVSELAQANQNQVRVSHSNLPVRPIKGQMLSVIAHGVLERVVRAPEVYMVPRSDGRLLIGATLEDAGYDKRVDPAVIQRLRLAATKLLPSLGEARIHEAWTGLRPGTTDQLPILGRTAVDGYFVATGHYRDGILLTPITAHLLAQVVRGKKTDYPLEAFSPARFG